MIHNYQSSFAVYHEDMQKQAAADRDRGARPFKRDIEIMATGHYGQSWALKPTEKEMKRGAERAHEGQRVRPI